MQYLCGECQLNTYNYMDDEQMKLFEEDEFNHIMIDKCKKCKDIANYNSNRSI